MVSCSKLMLSMAVQSASELAVYSILMQPQNIFHWGFRQIYQHLTRELEIKTVKINIELNKSLIKLS